MIESARTGARHRAPEDDGLPPRTDTLPIAADWSRYGRHAAPLAGPPAPRGRPPVEESLRGAAAPAPRVVTATVASPTRDLEAVTAKLEARLRARLAEAGLAAAADRTGRDEVVVTGPHESTDSYGRVWFWFRGTLRAYPVPEEPSWPRRPVPGWLGRGWRCTLTTAAEATRLRRDLRAQLERWSLAGDCTEDAGLDLLLAFEELTSNAFRHGAGAVDVTIAGTAAGWLLVVDDEAPDRPPVPAVGRDRALGGMGLGMVAGLSLAVGWQPGPGRKSVWAELPAHRPGHERSAAAVSA